jgi:crossover junction endodeoxyribonuclease RuvC
LKAALKVIGIDPGLANTGYGIVEGIGTRVERYAFGTIRTSAKQQISIRLNHIFSKLCSIFEAEKPDLIAVEGVFSLGRNPQSGISLGKVCGIVLVAGAQCGISTEEWAPRDVKRVLTGNGNASKTQVERSVRHILKEKQAISPSHASDALGLAIVGLLRNR